MTRHRLAVRDRGRVPLYAFDGTWLSDKNISNVHLFYEAYKHVYGESEAEYYPGVGNEGSMPRRVFDGFTGWGTAERADAAYVDLLERVSRGDGKLDSPLFIVGFSRGAASAMYLLNNIARGAGNLPPVRFVGLFDTVRSVGVPVTKTGRTLGRNTLRPKNDMFNDRIGNLFGGTQVRHAISLDERRRPFELRDPLERVVKELLDAFTRIEESTPMAAGLFARLTKGFNERFNTLRGFEEAKALEASWGTKQVYFRGVHSDIGGKRVKRSGRSLANTGLCDIALLWMLEQALEARVRAVLLVDLGAANAAHAMFHDMHDFIAKRLGRPSRWESEPQCTDRQQLEPEGITPPTARRGGTEHPGPAPQDHSLAQ